MNDPLTLLEQTYVDILNVRVDSACTDRDTSHVDPEGLGSLAVFELACLLSYGVVVFVLSIT